MLETKRSRCTRVAGGKACGTNGVRIESKENPSKRAGANGKGMLAGRFDIITDALTNARVRRQERKLENRRAYLRNMVAVEGRGSTEEN